MCFFEDTRFSPERIYQIICLLMGKSVDGRKRLYWLTFAVSIAERSGQSLRVATLERTLVDVLDRPELSGSWEEIWRHPFPLHYILPKK